MANVDREMLNVDGGTACGPARKHDNIQHSTFNTQQATSNKQRATSNKRTRAFSFAEVMFAVIILGIGFIMIAGLFPVAISQSRATANETSAAAFARVASNYVGQLASNANMPGSYTLSDTITVPQVLALPPSTSDPAIDSPSPTTLFQATSGNIISADDPRYAWVPFYYRGLDPNSVGGRGALPYAQLILICVQATNYPVFSDTDIHPPSGGLRNLRGRPVRVAIANSPTGIPDYIGFEDSASKEAVAGMTGAVAEGCFVIIRGDITSPNPSGGLNGGRTTGRIYRVGVRRTDLDGQKVTSMFYPATSSILKKGTLNMANLQVWELAPGSDFTPEPPITIATTTQIIPAANAPGDSVTGSNLTSTNPVEAYVIGRSFVDPNNAAKGFEGPAMDVAAYSTIIYCKQ